MLRSMFTAISSLNINQSYLDVVANNLANANTIGYKSNRMTFQDQFSQLLYPGAAPTTTVGGTNPTSVGLGARLGAISPNFAQGALQATGRNLDLAVQGDGFFIYGTGADRRYSRVGALAVDGNGLLVDSSTGMALQGWQVTPPAPVDPTSAPGNITIPPSQTMASMTAKVTLGGNLNADLTANPWQDATGTATDFKPASYTVTVGAYDSLGNAVSVPVTFTRTADSTWSWKVGDGAATDLTFDENGRLDPNTTGSVTLPAANGAAEQTVTLDFSSITSVAGSNSAAVTSQDGLPAGNLTDVYITPKDGGIYLVYSNGMRQQIGQVAIARFTNPAGLLQTGNTMYEKGLNSGEAQIGASNTGGRGSIASGYLEGSNVDMAQEFTNMIMAQRGFQASSRVVTTSDEILQELVNLKR
jgi:flagellar hook protein FlgE